MKKTLSFIVILILLGVAAGGGYWMGRNKAAPETAPAQSVAPSTPTERKVLYYRNPMGLPDTSPVPKKDSMGMDYIPVYEGEDDDGSTVRVSLDRVQRSGVRTETAEMRMIAQPVRAPGVAKPDELWRRAGRVDHQPMDFIHHP